MSVRVVCRLTLMQTRTTYIVCATTTRQHRYFYTHEIYKSEVATCCLYFADNHTHTQNWYVLSVLAYSHSYYPHTWASRTAGCRVCSIVYLSMNVYVLVMTFSHSHRPNEQSVATNANQSVFKQQLRISHQILKVFSLNNRLQQKKIFFLFNIYLSNISLEVSSVCFCDPIFNSTRLWNIQFIVCTL